MNRFGKQNLKTFYVLSSLGILLSLALAISLLFLSNYRQSTHAHYEKLREEIIRSKREFIKDAVDRTIQQIEQERALCASGRYGKCDEATVKELLREHIRSIRLKDDGYIWINAVVNYAGGEDYAYRFVHPNLPKTEGMMLSTSMRDIKGNFPYRTELEGVKEKGEIFFDYWFKKMNSDAIQHKLTYARLYRPYDWIVATGVYLDDVDQLVQSGMARWEANIRQNVLFALALTGIASLLAWILSLLVGKRADLIYSRFVRELAEKEQAQRDLLETLECRIRERTASLESMNKDLEDEIARREEAQRRVTMMARALDNAADAVFLIDGEHRFSYVNDAACRSLGYSREELLTMGTLDIDPDITPVMLREMEGIAADTGIIKPFETRHRAKNGRIFPVEIYTTTYENNGGIVAIATARDISERKQSEQVVRARLRMQEAANATDISTEDTLRLMLDEIETQTGSSIAFYHFMLEDQQTLSLQNWSSNTLRTICTAEGKGRHYPVAEAGVWADCVRERRPIIHNDYASLPNRRGMPAGHAEVSRELVVPIFRESRIVAIIGVGNKPADYDEIDVQIASLLGDFSWEIASRKVAEEQLRESEERLRLTLEATQIGTWDWDVEHDIWRASPVYYTMLGYEPKTGQGDREEWMARLHSDDKALFTRKTLDVLSRNFDDYQYEARLRHADGTWRWQFVKGFGTRRDSEGKVTRMLGIRLDINDRKAAEEKIRILNEGLELRVKERTNELEQANDRLQELDRLKTMFIASMSHELRTPLNSAIGFSRILEQEWAGPLNAEQKENVATVLKSCNHLLALINDVIDVSKIEAGMITAEPEEFDVGDLVSEAATCGENAVGDKNVELRVNAIYHTMHTDRTRLLQCLLNLVSNAAKYTEQGTINIGAKVAEGGEMLELSVEDTGIGIRGGDFDKLFHPFVRLDSHLKATVPGTGLGLYLTRKLVTEVLGGTITVQSVHGKGSVFVLAVPVSL